MERKAKIINFSALYFARLGVNGFVKMGGPQDGTLGIASRPFTTDLPAAGEVEIAP